MDLNHHLGLGLKWPQPTPSYGSGRVQSSDRPLGGQVLSGSKMMLNISPHPFKDRAGGEP